MTERTQPNGGAIRVGDFVVDPRTGELRGEAGKQILSGQPLHLLLALAEHPGELVTRDELRARLWPSDTFVDFEHGLNAVVKRLRDALGDSVDTPRYIETVPRRGYRLLAAVTPGDAPSAPSTQAEAAEALPTTVTAPRLHLRGWSGAGLAGAFLLVALATVAALHSVRSWVVDDAAGAEAPAAPGEAIRLTFGPGLQTDAAWSPDGRRIAYTADRGGNFDLFVQSLDGGAPVPITSSPANETQPAWSPDGKRLVFRSDEDGGALFTVGLDGGAPRRIAGSAFQPVWMPDGRDIAFASSQLLALYLVKADGGEAPRQILADAMKDGAWFSFAVHPDGRIGLLGVHPEWRYGFYVSDRALRALRSATAERPFVKEFPAVRRAFWSPGGDAVFVEVFKAGAWNIVRVPVDPDTQAWGAPVAVPTGTGAAEYGAISPDGRVMAFTSTQTTTRAWVFPFDADRRTPLGEGRPITDEDASVDGLSMSTDGSAIFYIETRRGRRTQPGVRTSVDTGETTVLVDDPFGPPVPAPSGAGTAYLMIRIPTGHEAQYALGWRTSTGRERLLTPWGSGATHVTDVRRDDRALLGSWMPRAYTGGAALTEWTIGETPVAQPRRVLLESPTRQFWQGRYSPDGRWVSFVSVSLDSEGPLELGIVPASADRAATWERIAADHPWPDKPRWSPDGRTLYFLSRAASGLFDLWGVGIDPARGVAVGEPFRVARFDSPRWHVETDLESCEMGIARDRLVLPMQTVKGSVWMLPLAGT